MTRYFCDLCGKEITPTGNRVSHRLKRSLYNSERYHNVQAEVMVGVKGVTNGGHVCTDCVIRIVTEGTDVRA